MPIDFIAESVEALVRKFELYPNIFLTEEDVRSHLFSYLLEKCHDVERTRDNDHSIALHSEVRWYGDGALKYRSDIVILDVATLEVLHHDQLPSKGYGFNSPKAIIELKLRRANGPSDSVFKQALLSDIRKLQELERVFSPGSREPIAYWLIALDKKSGVNVDDLFCPSINLKYCFKRTA